MNRTEFIKIAEVIKTFYPREGLLPTMESMDLWFEDLKDLDFAAVTIAVKKYALTNRFPPTVADIREYAVGITESDQANEIHAWNLVYKALRNSINHADEEFARLPPAVQRAVHSPGQLREWAMMDINTVNSVVSSNFMRTYKVEAARENTERNMPKSLKRLEQEVAERLSVGKNQMLSSQSGAIPEGTSSPRALTGTVNSVTEERIACEQNATKNEAHISDMMAKLRQTLYGNKGEH